MMINCCRCWLILAVVLFCLDGNAQTLQADEDVLFDRSGQSGQYEEESAADDWVNLNTASYPELIRWATPSGRSSVDSVYRYRFLFPIRSETDLLAIPGVSEDWVSRLEFNQDGWCQLKGKRSTMISHRTTSAGFSNQLIQYRQLTTIKTDLLPDWSTSLTIERDPGESRATDHLAGFVHFQPRQGWIRSLTFGNYRPRLGSGLAWGGVYAPMKGDQLFTVQQLWKTSIQPLAGSLEGSGAFGIASDIGWERWNLVTGFSHKRMDGYPYSLTDNPAFIFLHPDTDGLHVTGTERKRRGQLTESFQFGWIGYELKRGAIQLHAFRKSYQSENTLQKLEEVSPVKKKGSLNPGDQVGWGGSVQFQIPGNHLAGECLFFGHQMSGSAAWDANLPGGLRSMVMARYLGIEQPSLYAGILSERIPVTGNEAGLYTGVDYRTQNWTVAVILDRWEQIFPDPERSGPTHGSDWLLSGTMKAGVNSECRLGMAFSNDRGPDPALRRKWKVSWKQAIGPLKMVQFRWDFLENLTSKKEGTAFTIRVNSYKDSWFSTSGQVSWFVVNDATVRPFIADPEVPGLMVFRALYQQGIRVSALTVIKPESWPEVALKWAVTHVSDVLNPGSSVVMGATQEGTVQIRWNL